MSFFRIGLLVGFLVVALIGVVMFANFGAFSDNADVGDVTIWGTLDRSAMQPVVAELKSDQDGFSDVSYVQRDAQTFEETVINALASGTGPDVILVTSETFGLFADKAVAIPFDQYSERAYRDTFINAADIYLRTGSNSGVLAFPLVVDPLVMYWNRSLLASEGFALPPRVWEEMSGFATRLSREDERQNLTQSAVAFGAYENVRNARAVLSMLFQQVGNPIVTWNETGTDLASAIRAGGDIGRGTESALRFYTSFGNPAVPTYSWNRGLPEDRQHFLSGDLAVYFGFASELSTLRQGNPNLNFDVSRVPQQSTESARTTFGNVFALTIPRTARNVNGGAAVARALSEAKYVGLLSEALQLPPARRDLITEFDSGEAVQSTVYESALFSESWAQPGASVVDAAFGTLIADILSGRASIGSALTTTSSVLDDAFSR